MPPTLQYVCQASRWQRRKVLQNKIRNVLELSFYLGDNCSKKQNEKKTFNPQILTLSEENEGNWVISLPIEFHSLVVHCAGNNMEPTLQLEAGKR